MQQWQVQQAEARRDDILRNAQDPGPQDIMVLGLPVALVLSVKDYKRLCGAKLSCAAFMGASPLAGVELDIERSTTPARDPWSA